MNLQVLHELGLEDSDHWKTTEKAIVNGGISTRVIIFS